MKCKGGDSSQRGEYVKPCSVVTGTLDGPDWVHVPGRGYLRKYVAPSKERREVPGVLPIRQAFDGWLQTENFYMYCQAFIDGSRTMSADSSVLLDFVSAAADRKRWDLVRRGLLSGMAMPRDRIEHLMYALLDEPENGQTLATMEVLLQVTDGAGADIEADQIGHLMRRAVHGKRWGMAGLLAESATDLTLADRWLPGGGMAHAAAACIVDSCPSEKQRAAADALHAFARLGADLNALNSEGDTPVMMLARHGRFKDVMTVLKQGAEMDVKSCTVTCQESNGSRRFIVDWECAAGSSVGSKTFHCASCLSSAGMAMLLKDFHQYAAADSYLREGEKQINRIGKWQKGTRQLGGHIFEIQQASTFNAEAALKGSSARASTTAALGRPKAAADVLIHEDGVCKVSAQLKSGNTAARTIAKPQYDGMQRVVPKGMTKAVPGTQDALALGNVKAKAISQKQIDALTGQAKVGKAHLAIRSLRALRLAGWVLWLGNATVSVVRNSVELFSGDKTLSEAAFSFVKDTTPLGLITDLWEWLGARTEESDASDLEEPADVSKVSADAS